MDLPRSTYLAGIAGVAIGLGGTLLYRRTSPGRGDETLVRLAAALEGLTAQLNVLQESLGRIEELVRERQQAAACDDNTDARQLVDGIQLRSRSVNSRYSAYSSGAQSDAFDTAEEDNVQSTDDEEDQDSLPAFLDHIDELHARKDDLATTQQEVFDLLTAKCTEFPDECQLLWRYARVHKNLSDMSGTVGSTEEQKQQIYSGLAHAKRAVELDEQCWQAHQWYAILLGLTGKFESTQNKVSNGIVFKKHVDRAIELNSRDYSLFHLLGQYNYAVASLTWVERNAAKMLYGEVPSSTYGESLENFMSTERLNKDPWKANKLMVAKCHYGLGQYAECKQWLEKAQELGVVSDEDHKSQTEIAALLQKL